jgi:HPt (histidine-containing phosphotransfer) domain-containing protein
MSEAGKLYDTKSLTQTHKADSEFIHYMIDLFLETIPKTIAKLKKASHEEDWKTVYFYAHKLKTSIDLFNLVPLKQLIREVEIKAKKETETATIAKDVDFISDYIKKSMAAMKHDFKKE